MKVLLAQFVGVAMLCRMRRILCFLCFFCCFVSLAAIAAEPSRVTWEQQAERLQNVSASLLDSVPVSVVPAAGFRLGVAAAVSILPDVDPRVGGKSERVPSSPIHTVPQLQTSYGLGLAVVRLTGRVWAGYLPAGTESLIGLKAKLSQWTAGAALGVGVPLQIAPFVSHPAVEVGVQVSEAELRGSITEANASDSFDSATALVFLSAGFQPERTGLHAVVLLATKSTKSKFVVSSSRTELELTDTLADAQFPYLLQGQIGWRFPLGVTVGVAELWVPSRLAMPRIFGQFEYLL
jgi:hypothetical protein